MSPRATNKAECIRRAREARKMLADLIEELERPGPPTAKVQPIASHVFEKARSLEREVFILVRKRSKGGSDGP